MGLVIRSTPSHLGGTLKARLVKDINDKDEDIPTQDELGHRYRYIGFQQRILEAGWLKPKSTVFFSL